MFITFCANDSARTKKKEETKLSIFFQICFYSCIKRNPVTPQISNYFAEKNEEIAFYIVFFLALTRH
jgi:hypothetical protein